MGSKAKKKKGLNKLEFDGKSDLSCENGNSLFLGSIMIKLREEDDLRPEQILLQLKNLKSLLSAGKSQIAVSNDEPCDTKGEIKITNELKDDNNLDAKLIFSLELVV